MNNEQFSSCVSVKIWLACSEFMTNVTLQLFSVKKKKKYIKIYWALYLPESHRVKV